MSTHYEVLGVSPDATASAIRKAYLQQCLKHHPDKNPDNVEEAKIRFIQIGKAYEILKDESERHRYDLELLQAKSKTSTRNTRTSSATSDQTTRTPYAEKYDPASTFFQSSSHKPTSQETDDLFSSYEDAFDSFVGNLSEDEVQTAMGAAALVGGLIGSMIGGRKGSNLMATAGSILGSQAGSRMVQSAHQQSVQRLQYEDRRQQAIRRGERVPEKPKGFFARMAKNIENFADGNSQYSTSNRSHSQSNFSSSRYNTYRASDGNLYSTENTRPSACPHPASSTDYVYQTFRGSDGQLYTVPVANSKKRSRSYRGQVEQESPSGLETAVKVLGTVGAFAVGAMAAASQNRADNTRRNNVRNSRRY